MRYMEEPIHRVRELPKLPETNTSLSHPQQIACTRNIALVASATSFCKCKQRDTGTRP